MTEKSCSNCANVSKYTYQGKESMACEEYGFYHLGWPANCDPPYDDACELWTDDPEKANTWERMV